MGNLLTLIDSWCLSYVGLTSLNGKRALWIANLEGSGRGIFEGILFEGVSKLTVYLSLDIWSCSQNSNLGLNEKEAEW
jgi:hypothetical protein